MSYTLRIDGHEAVLGTLDGFSARRIRAVVATALTRTARDLEPEWKAEIFRNIDRPTALTLNSVVVTPATAETLQAAVFIRDQPARPQAPAPVEWLSPQESGGGRYIKRFELALQLQGSMPAGYQVVPGRYAELDGYGNISRAQITQVIAQLGRDFSPGYARTISKRLDRRLAYAARHGRDYVAITRPVGRLPMGIYQRDGRDLLPVFVFKRRVTYRKRTSFDETAMELGPVRLTAHIERAIGEHVARLAAAGRLPGSQR